MERKPISWRQSYNFFLIGKSFFKQSPMRRARGVRCIAGVRQRRRSAAHVRRCVCPRRCRGLTEGETARAVGLRLWRSGVPGYGRVPSLCDDECGCRRRWSEAVMSLLPDSIRKLCDKCTLFSNRCAGVCQRRRSAAHLRRCVCPRRCRGLTEDVTARAVRLRHYCESR